MKNTFLFGSLLLIFSLFFGCNSSQTTSNISEDSALTPGELITQNILHNGDEREYQLYLPSSYNEGAAYPVLLNFHGFGGNAKDYFAYEGCDNTEEVRKSVLGDIYHSNINIVGKPDGSIQYTNEFQTGFYRSQNGYSNFMSQHSGRREIIYVGANDGMLHAFDATTGNELWAFIPPSLHPKLSTMISTKANSTNSIYGVDGSSSVKPRTLS